MLGRVDRNPNPNYNILRYVEMMLVERVGPMPRVKREAP